MNPTSWRTGFFVILLVLSIVVGVATILPFLPALLWALVLGVLTFPLHQRWTGRLSRARFLGVGRAETASSLLVTLFTLVVICIPFLLVGLGLYVQVGDAVSRFQGQSFDEIVGQLTTSAKPLLERFGVKEADVLPLIRENAGRAVQGLREPVSQFAGKSIFTALTLVVALLTQFFGLRDGARLWPAILDLSPLRRAETEQLFGRVKETIFAVFVGTVLVAILQGSIIGVTYALTGVPNALLLGVISVILCIVPLLGAPVIYIPVALVHFARGDVQAGAITLGVGFLIVSQIDNLIKPFLIGSRVNLHPMAIFFAILGGVLLVGPIGVMIGPVLLAVLLALVDVWRERAKAEEVS